MTAKIYSIKLSHLCHNFTCALWFLKNTTEFYLIIFYSKVFQWCSFFLALYVVFNPRVQEGPSLSHRFRLVGCSLPESPLVRLSFSLDLFNVRSTCPLSQECASQVALHHCQDNLNSPFFSPSRRHLCCTVDTEPDPNWEYQKE